MKTRGILSSSILACVMILLLTSLAAAQTSSTTEKAYADKGVLELGGSVGFTSFTGVSAGQTSSTTYTSFSLTPSVGYFVTDGLEVGLDPFSLTINSHTGASSSQTEIHILGGIGYAAKTQGAAYPFVEGVAGFSSVSEGSYSANGFTWGLRGGVKVALVQHVLLMVGVQYLQVTENPTGASSRYGYNQFLVGAGFSIWL